MEKDTSLYKDPEEYLTILKYHPQSDIKELVDFYGHIDYCGSAFLSKEEFGGEVRKFGVAIGERAARKSFVDDERIFLRGVDYYPGYIPLLKASALQFLKRSLSTIQPDLDYLVENADKCENMIDRLFLSRCLDQRKNLALLLFTGLFQSMLKDESIPLDVFDKAYIFCQDTIENYYSFLVSRATPNIREYDLEEVISSINAEIVYSSQRSLSREMDHPGRILLYAANMCDLVNEPYDFSVNPLRGAAEIGFAIKAISKIIDKEVIEHLNFVRYSTHDERHDAVTNVCELMEKYIPHQLWRAFEAMRERRVIIIDDNITGGNTLKNLKCALDTYCRTVDVSVVEINREHLYELLEDKGEERRVFPTKNMLPASIGEWRDQREIVKLLEKRMRQQVLHRKV